MTAHAQATAPAADIIKSLVSSPDAQDLLAQVIEATERNQSRGEIKLTDQGVDFGNFEGVQRYAAMLHDAGLGPKPGKDDNRQTMIAKMTASILLGRRLGMQPELAVTSIYVVNGVANLFGDAPLAICRQHPAWDESGFAEWFEVGGKRIDAEPDPDAFKADTTAAVTQTLRKGAKTPRVSRFSMAHAKAASLLGKNGSLYGPYAQRMLRFRARGYCLRDNFGDALKGIGIRELHDEPKEEPQDRTQAVRERLAAAKGSELVETPQSEAPAPQSTPEEKARDEVAQIDLDREAFTQRYEMAQTMPEVKQIENEVNACGKEKRYGQRWVSSFANVQAEAIKRIEGSGN